MKDEVRHFLASGKLEEYLMGLTNEVETQEVEYFINEYPQVKEYYHQLQAEIDEYADKYPVPPSRTLQNQILSELNRDYTRYIGWGFAGLFLISAIFWGINKNNKILELQDKVHALQHDYEDTNSNLVQLSKNFTSLSHPHCQKLHLLGNKKMKKVCMVAYWNSEDKSSHLQINKAPKIDKHDYQLWADINGKMTNLGIINCKEKINEIPYFDNTSSLNITLEPEGGSEEPSLDNLVASVEIH